MELYVKFKNHKQYLMKKSLVFFLFLFGIQHNYAQTQKYPVFRECNTATIEQMENCFLETVKNKVLDRFRVPVKVESDNFSGTVKVLFFVTRRGNFQVIHVSSPYKEITQEVNRVFRSLPRVVPAQFNGHSVDMNFALPLNFPNPKLSYGTVATSGKVSEVNKPKKKLTSVVKKKKKRTVPGNGVVYYEHYSGLNIPFHHGNYSQFERALVNDENTHTSVKPFRYSKVSELVDLDSQKNKYLKKKKTWLGRKFWNEHLATVVGDNYWFTTNMLLDVQMGKDNSDVPYTFNNSRILQVQGELGEKLSFSATIFESQGRFAGFINEAIDLEQWKTFSSEGLVFGRGKAKRFKEDSYDYPVSEGYLSYTPNEIFNFQFGQGKNFIGDGYRSMMVSDISAPYPYAKITTNFWKFQYTNLWMWMTDIRFAAKQGNAHPRKYVSSHHLSIKLNKKLTLGFYEGVMTDNTRTGVMDMDFVNPLIFYKSLEFARGEDAGSNVLGVNALYRFSDDFSMYSQFVLDEFTLEEIKAQRGYWGNKYAFQLGAKYFNAFKVDNLFLQGEFNYVRPYTFSHKTPILNYGHYGQSIAHNWGANFWETVLIARYQKERWMANFKLILGAKGFDENGLNYGGDIFLPYTTRVQEYNNEVGQGAKATILNTDLQVSYLINPTTDLKVFGGLVFRKFTPEIPTTTFLENTTTWFTLGLKVDLFNWYLDF